MAPEEPLTGKPRIGSRRWIAWKLVQLAHRVFDAEYYERIVIHDPEGDELIEFVINADLYGGGVSSQTGWDSFAGGYHVAWYDNFHPDWLRGEA